MKKLLLLYLLLASVLSAQGQITNPIPAGGFKYRQDQLVRSGWLTDILTAHKARVDSIVSNPVSFTSLPGRPTYYPTNIANVSSLQSALDAKAAIANYYDKTTADGRYKPMSYSPAFTIGTVTSLSAGSTPTASWRGTPDVPILDLGIPSGLPGSPGSASGIVTSINGVSVASGTNGVSLNADQVPAGTTNKYALPSNIRNVTDTLYSVVQPIGTVNGTQDNTQQIVDAFATADEVRLKKGNYIVSRLILPTGKHLIVPRGAKITGRALTTGEKAGLDHYGIIELSPGASLSGRGIIEGNKASRTGTNAHGVYFINSDSVSVSEVTVRNTAGSGIRFQNSHKAKVTSTEILRVDNIGIEAIISNDAQISNNRVRFALHGIQFWGDSTSHIYASNITITGNNVSNIAGGGIWGHYGRYITVAANNVSTCNDVGIDFENSADCVASANTVQNCTNAALSIFFGSKRISFADNTIVQGTGYGHALKIFAGGLSEDITVSGGSMLVQSYALIFTEDLAVKRLNITGIKSATSVTGSAVTAQRVDGLSVTNCNFVSGGAYGIYTTGGSYGRIEGNNLTYSGSSSSTAKALYMVWLSSSYPAQHNIVRGNAMPTFGLGIHNDMGGDNTGYNTITDNISTMVTTPGGGGDFSIIERNRNAAGAYVDATQTYTGAEKTKLTSIATGATVNSPDATLLNRANHTGSQAESTITNLTTDLALGVQGSTAQSRAVPFSSGTFNTTNQPSGFYAILPGASGTPYSDNWTGAIFHHENNAGPGGGAYWNGLLINLFDPSVAYLGGEAGATSTALPYAQIQTSIVSTVTGTTQQAVRNGKYITNNASRVVITLPTDSNISVGEQVHVRGLGSGGWKIAQNASQVIHHLTNSTSGTGGYIQSGAQYDTVTIEKIASNEFTVTAYRGTLTVN